MMMNDDTRARGLRAQGLINQDALAGCAVRSLSCIQGGFP